MKEISTETLIIGAGPAGLATAMELSKANKDFIVIEKQKQVGGLSRTYVFNEDGLEFRTDNGPHRFFSKNPYLYDFISDILKEKWIKVSRYTRQYIDGKFYDYPVNGLQALRNVGIKKAFFIIFYFAYAKFKFGVFRKKINNFEDYVHAHFGRTLGEFGIINYTEKVWGIPAKEIHPDWAVQRIKGLDVLSLVKSMIKKFLHLRNNSPKTLIDTFFYPQFGTGLIYETIVQILREKNYRIFLGANILNIYREDTTFKYLIMDCDGEKLKIKFKNLVESVPINSFLKLIEPKVSGDVSDFGIKLRYRSQVYLFITLNKESVSRDQWIYFPTKDVPIGRVSEMKNFSKYMSPKGKTSIFVEFFCFEGDRVWNMTKKELLNMVIPHFEKMKLFRRKEVRKYYLLKEKDVYPIYDLDYMNYLDKIKKYLNSFENLFYIGRPGRFRYNNQDHSLEMGILTAKSIIDGVKYDIEGIGTENSYFESGKLYEGKDKKHIS